ncbi:deoxyribodipyrimidine photo-lyase [Corallincola holothuriorum]|uniref:Deoxyribodipyrimidine photo-lyase n=1 Tax=Corallincola holothuriorum TaxID=2282215 RepID=A0A368NS24_9GAMM|nr:deoxyribodipyrimidine photo-lyase [Corallincola holothuriorum]RCU52625.1 deoxyribodipyrimidine photo-lyase [Corallincola holothuriorum]
MAKLVWFRDDLRTLDNPALFHACEKDEGQVFAIYVISPTQWLRHHWSPSRIGLIRRRIEALTAELAALNIGLTVLMADTYSEIPELIASHCQANDIDHLFINKEVGFNEGKRDREVKAALQLLGVATVAYDTRAILPPGSVLTGKDKPFSVFTPFKKAWLRLFSSAGVSCLPRPKARQCHTLSSSHNEASSWPENIDVNNSQTVTEEQILGTLRQFVAEKVKDYHADRDVPAIAGTSALSPFLAIGAISARQCIARLLYQGSGDLSALSEGENVWLSELVWRDFYRHLIEAYPRLSMHRSFKPAYDSLQWCNDAQLFQQWCDGLTGYPLVDAGMRQLKHTGWMHNRLRMVVASFLTKHLLIDWRWGERYFMQQLVDGDLAANNGGWQWAASTGADSVPYFRIFNPLLQAKRFDPDGSFIRKWVPELKSLAVPEIFEPHKKGRNLLAGDYPMPVVIHAEARQRALAFYKGINDATLP